jgi:hypothetical protein
MPRDLTGLPVIVGGIGGGLQAATQSSACAPLDLPGQPARLTPSPELGGASSRFKMGGFMAQLRLPDLATRLQGLAVAPDRPRWVYASLANLRRGVVRRALKSATTGRAGGMRKAPFKRGRGGRSVRQTTNELLRARQGPPARTVSVRLCNSVQSSPSRLHDCFPSAYPTGIGGEGRQKPFSPCVVTQPDYSRSTVFIFTQETAEPLRFSPAEPVAYLRVSQLQVTACPFTDS